MFWITALAVAIVQFFGVLPELRKTDGLSVLYYYNVQVFGVSTVFLAALPFSAAFCGDWRYRFARYGIERTSVNAYAWSKMITNALGGALAVGLGMTLFFLIMQLRYQLIDRESSALISSSGVLPYGPILLGAYPALYFVVIVVLQALGAVIYASVAMAVSSWIPNLFVALSCPILFFYLLVNAIPVSIWHFNPLYLYFNMSADIGSPAQSMAFTIGYTVIWFILLGLLFNWGVRRRLRHE